MRGRGFRVPTTCPCIEGRDFDACLSIRGRGLPLARRQTCTSGHWNLGEIPSPCAELEKNDMHAIQYSANIPHCMYRPVLCACIHHVRSTYVRTYIQYTHNIIVY